MRDPPTTLLPFNLTTITLGTTIHAKMIYRLHLVLALVVVLLALVPYVPHPELEWNESVLPMAQSFAGAHSTTPLSGKVAVITGATSGIGLSLTRMLSRLGATVVALGRSQSKLSALKEEIPTVETLLVDLVDLNSVAKAAQQLAESYDAVDILVNNAGMHDGLNNLLGTHETKQGFDKVFGVNYLSHFLLTEKLAPKLANATKPVLLQVSSSYHWVVDGSDLMPVGEDPPLASTKGGSHGFILFRSTRSYANSKLAQILHARALKRHDPLFADTRVISACPAWVQTQIVKADSLVGGIFRQAMSAGAFDADGWGMASILLALFDDSENSKNDFYSNTLLFDTAPYVMAGQTGWLYKIGVRDIIGTIMAFSILPLQKLFPDAKAAASSPESYNEILGDALYKWSKSAVAPFM